MKNPSLHEFVGRIGVKNRITFGDVRRLQRDVLPDGITSREEVELLLRIDGAVSRADAAWTTWLVASVTAFAVWSERPTGRVEREAACWLKGLLETAGGPTKAARRIALEIRREADRVEEPMASYLSEHAPEDACAGDMPPRPVPAAAGALCLAA